MKTMQLVVRTAEADIYDWMEERLDEIGYSDRYRVEYKVNRYDGTVEITYTFDYDVDMVELYSLL